MATYRRLSKIGDGGQGEVYRAKRLGDDQLVAVKYLRSDADENLRKRFTREVRIQSSLHHPNIMPILGYRLEGTETPFFVMPLAKNNLRDRFSDLAGNSQLAFSYYEQILAAVEHAHDNGIVHRDLKPENILMLDGPEGDYPVLSDFGAGKSLDSDSTPLTGSMAVIGTPGYAAPEQWGDARDVDYRCDIFALGVILHEILTGRTGTMLSDLSALPNGLGYAVEKCIQLSPDDRYQSVAQLRRDFLIFTTQTELLEEPAQAAKRLIETLALKATIATEDIRPLDAIFQENLHDELLLTGTFARLPDRVLDAYVRHLSTPFRRVLRAYDEAVTGSLAFEYCDVVATFYSKLYAMFGDRGTKRLILSRLLEIAVSHNRFFVMGVVVDMLAGITNAAEAALAREVLLEHPYECQQLRGRLLNDLRLPLLRQAVKEASQEDADDIEVIEFE